MLKVFQVHYMNLFGTAMCNRRKIIDKNAKKLEKYVKKQIKLCVKKGRVKTDVIPLSYVIYERGVDKEIRNKIYEETCETLSNFYGNEVDVIIIYDHYYSTNITGLQATINKV